MKAAMVFDGLMTGGVERVGADYARLLDELGYEITIFNLNPKLTEMEEFFPEKCDIEHINFNKKFAPERYAQLIKMKWYGRFVYPLLFLLLTFFNYMYKTYCKVSYKKLNRDFDVAIAFSGHFNDLTFVADNFVTTRKKMCWLHGALYGYVLISDGYLNLYKKIKNLVVLVSDSEEEVMTYHKYLNLNVTKLYNPTFMTEDLIEDESEDTLVKKYGDYLLMVARFSYPHKDHYTVIDALKILNNKYQKYPNLVLVGTGPDEESVKKYVEKNKDTLKSKIYFLGNKKEVKAYYKAAKLLVHASVAGEGLPTVMLEALANQLPMVVTDSKVGPREILGNDAFGLLCKVKDPVDMADKINKLLENKELYLRYVESSTKRLNDFSPEAIKKELKLVIDNLV